MVREKKGPPLERLIRRCLKNGIKTLSGKDNQKDPTVGTPKTLTYQGDRDMFLAILQADAAQIEHRFDAGANGEEFKQLVERIVLELEMEGHA